MAPRRRTRQKPTPLASRAAMSLFGAAPAPAAVGGLFGAPGAGAGLFGAPAPAPAAGGGLFGATPAAPAGAPAGGGLFGAPAAAPAAGGGLFGAAAPGAAAGMGLFAAAPAAAGGLFGAAAPAPAAAGGLFGAAAAPAPAGGGGLFGAAPATLGGGLFGATAAAPAPSGGLFGAPAVGAGGTSLFGATGTMPSLGLGTPALGAPSALTTPGAAAAPAQPAPAAGGSMDAEVFEQWQRQMVKAWDDKDYKLCSFKYIVFNDLSQVRVAMRAAARPPMTTRTLSARSRANRTRAHARQPHAPVTPVPSAPHACAVRASRLCRPRLTPLLQAGPGGCMVPPSAEVLQRARAESLAASDTGLWERADEQNPDPMRFVPAQITGFNALHERRQQQVQAARDLASKLRTSHDELRKLDDERKVRAAAAPLSSPFPLFPFSPVHPPPSPLPPLPRAPPRHCLPLPRAARRARMPGALRARRPFAVVAVFFLSPGRHRASLAALCRAAALALASRAAPLRRHRAPALATLPWGRRAATHPCGDSMDPSTARARERDGAPQRGPRPPLRSVDAREAGRRDRGHVGRLARRLAPPLATAQGLARSAAESCADAHRCARRRKRTEPRAPHPSTLSACAVGGGGFLSDFAF